MAHDIFISYSSKDKVVADAVCASLENARRRCWIAPRDILPGESWGEAIIDAINESKLMIIIFSENSNTSQQVVREVERAVSRNTPIIPFRIENVKPTKSMEYFLSTPHWLDAIDDDLEKHIGELVVTVGRMLGPIPMSDTISDPVAGKTTPSMPLPPTTPVVITKAEPKSKSEKDHRKTVFLFAAIAILLIALASVTTAMLMGRGKDEHPIAEETAPGQTTTKDASEKTTAVESQTEAVSEAQTTGTRDEGNNGEATDTETGINVRLNSFMTLGTYRGEPILWRVMSVEGDEVLLFSEHIIDYMPFDAPEGGSDEDRTGDRDGRYYKGSNYWGNSTIRDWLNSADEQVAYSSYPPDARALGADAYADWPGFLRSFTAAERSLIQPTTHKVLLTETDFYLSEGHEDGFGHLFDSTFDYDTKPFEMVTDRVFLLSVMELEGLEEQLGSLQKRSTDALSEQVLMERGIMEASIGFALRTPYYFEDPMEVLYAFEGRVDHDVAANAFGICPAMRIQLPASLQGQGTLNDPYWVDASTIDVSQTQNQESQTSGPASIIFRPSDFVQMGTYNGAPMTWRVIHVKADRVLVFSEEVIDFMVFDAPDGGTNEDRLSGGTSRRNQGSNYWRSASIRDWLNSEEQVVAYSNYPPDRMALGEEAYDTRAGFMTHFSSEERALIMENSHKSLLVKADDYLSEGSVEGFGQIYSYTFDYEEKPFETVTDRVFLLSVAELEYVKEMIGSYRKFPTEALDSQVLQPLGISADQVTYALRTPHYYEDPVEILFVADGMTDHDIAAKAYGVAPAFYLPLTGTYEGNGSYSQPYRLADGE